MESPTSRRRRNNHDYQKNNQGGAPALCEGGGGTGARLRRDREVGQVEADGPVIKGEGRRRRS